MAQLSDYTGLVTSEHADKPKFTAMVSTVTQCFVDQQNALASFVEAFDLDEADGVQLDILGEWIGISRKISTPISGVYFSLDTSGVGFDQGVWQGPFDPSTGIVSMDDATYLLILRAKIAANHWDGTIGSAAAILDSIFGSSTYVFIQDNQDMSMTVGLSWNLPSALFVALFGGGYIPLKPEGVLANYVVTSVNGDPCFGFDVENTYISGFDVGAWAIAA